MPQSSLSRRISELSSLRASASSEPRPCLIESACEPDGLYCATEIICAWPQPRSLSRFSQRRGRAGRDAQMQPAGWHEQSTSRGNISKKRSTNGIFFVPVAGHPGRNSRFRYSTGLFRSIGRGVGTHACTKPPTTPCYPGKGRPRPCASTLGQGLDLVRQLADTVFERPLSVAGQVGFVPLSGGLESLERSAERLFQRLIEARQRI